jgi:hypothetical protein
MTSTAPLRRAGAAIVWGAMALILAAASAPEAAAQSALSFTGQLRSAYPQSTIAEPAAAIAKTCSSISSMSRRCFFTFYKECEKRGESKEHCTRMRGFCHGCTDAYATCKSDRRTTAAKSNSASTDCAPCNAAYGRCISRMVEQYGGKLIKTK